MKKTHACALLHGFCWGSSTWQCKQLSLVTSHPKECFYNVLRTWPVLLRAPSRVLRVDHPSLPPPPLPQHPCCGLPGRKPGSSSSSSSMLLKAADSQPLQLCNYIMVTQKPCCVHEAAHNFTIQ
jgi:hypothetical protein